jgi:hypothetical protein
MQTGIITAAIAALALLGSAPQGDARPHRGHPSNQVHVSGYRSCGTPIYQQRYISHYQRCGTPVWRTRHVAPPRGYSYRAPVCRPALPVCPPPYYGGYPRNGVVIQGSFRL